VATIEINITCDVAGRPIDGSPFQVTLENIPQYDLVNVKTPVTAAGTYALIRGTHGAFPIVQALLLINKTEPIAYRLQGQTDSDIDIGAGGMLCLVGTYMDVGAGNLKANQPDEIGTIVGFVAGRGMPPRVPSTLVVDERWEATYVIPTTLVIDERWEGNFPVPTALVVDERWEGTYPVPSTLLVDERWEGTLCVTNVLAVHEDFESELCDTPNLAVHEDFES
jgi:hypothetical protein